MKHKMNGGYRVRIETTLSKIKKVQTRILYKGRMREREREKDGDEERKLQSLWYSSEA